jgi:predicted Zn-dependent protease with MMP-like domain
MASYQYRDFIFKLSKHNHSLSVSFLTELLATMLRMIQVSEEEFEKMVGEGIDSISSKYQKLLQNVAIVVEEMPSQEQLQRQAINPGQLLLGLHQGTSRAGQAGVYTGNLPDKITIFKRPHELISRDLSDLKEKVRHTVWHEVAHYFGLNHQEIHKRE